MLNAAQKRAALIEHLVSALGLTDDQSAVFGRPLSRLAARSGVRKVVCRLLHPASTSPVPASIFAKHWPIGSQRILLARRPPLLCSLHDIEVVIGIVLVVNRFPGRLGQLRGSGQCLAHCPTD
jgi:hypothetical protein